MMTNIKSLFYKGWLWAGLLLVTGSSISVAQGADLQQAIDSAMPGDTLMVPGGVYEANLFVTKPLTIVCSDTNRIQFSGNVTIQTTGSVSFVRAQFGGMLQVATNSALVVSQSVCSSLVSILGGSFEATESQLASLTASSATVALSRCSSSGEINLTDANFHSFRLTSAGNIFATADVAARKQFTAIQSYLQVVHLTGYRVTLAYSSFFGDARNSPRMNEVPTVIGLLNCESLLVGNLAYLYAVKGGYSPGTYTSGYEAATVYASGGAIHAYNNRIMISGDNWDQRAVEVFGFLLMPTAGEVMNNSIFNYVTEAYHNGNYEFGLGSFFDGGPLTVRANIILQGRANDSDRAIQTYGIYQTGASSITECSYNCVYSDNGPAFSGVTGVNSVLEHPLVTGLSDQNNFDGTLSPNNTWFGLQPNSPCINAGPADAAYNDANGTRNDIGHSGGPYWNPAHYTNDHPIILTLTSLRPATVAGSNISLVAFCAADAPPSYQWWFGGVAISGATNSILNISNAQPANAGSYFVIVSNAFGSVTSQVATLAVETTFERVSTGPVALDGGGTYGTAWVDLNDDGRLELFGLGYNQASLLYTNYGNGTFAKSLIGPLATNGIRATSASWADMDNDGLLDLFVVDDGNGGNPCRLFRNLGNGFTNINYPIAGGHTMDSAAWADYDGDGWVDLFVTSYDSSGVLLRNARDGNLQMVTGLPMTDDLIGTACAWGDYDNDGRPDLFVGGRAAQSNRIYRNQGNGSFSRVVLEDCIPTGEFAAGSWGDYNNDGFLDLFIANYGAQNNCLYQNNGNGTLTAVSVEGITTDGGRATSGAWADFDNDGFLDLFVSGLTNDVLFHNNGDGTFQRVTNSMLDKDGVNSQGAAWGDYDRDGFPDLYIAHYLNPTNSFYHNHGNSNAWITIRCRGLVSNRAALGAKVRVRAYINGNWRWQMREISSGQGRASQNAMEANFGLGDATNIDVVRIEWPSGIVQTFSNVAPRQFLTVQEQTILSFGVNGSGSVSHSPIKSNYFLGELITITATPRNTNWTRFVRWSDGDTNSTRAYTVGLTNLLTAIFTNFVPLELQPFKVWERTFGGTSDDGLAKVLRSPGGGFLIAAHSASGTNGNKTSQVFGGNDLWLIKLDADGNQQWQKSFGGSGEDDSVSGAVVVADGYVIGARSASPPSGNKTSPWFLSYDYWLLKVDWNGNKVWERTYGGSGEDSLMCLAATPDGGFLAGGRSTTATDGNKTTPFMGGTDGWLVRLDANGNKLWDRSFGGGGNDQLADIMPTPDGGCVLTCGTEPLGDDFEVLTIKLNSTGSIEWQRVDGGLQHDAAWSAAPGSDGGFVTVGNSTSGASGTRTVGNYGNHDGWLFGSTASGQRTWQNGLGGSGYDALLSVRSMSDGGFLAGGVTTSGADGNKQTASYGGQDGWLIRVDANGQRLWEADYGGGGYEQLSSIISGATGQIAVALHSDSAPSGNKTAGGFGLLDLWLLNLVEREAPVGAPAVLVNGLYSPSNSFFIPATNSVSVTLTSTFSGGYIYYTLDGTPPVPDEPNTFLYSSPTSPGSPFFFISSVVVRAVAYSSDETGNVEARSDPVAINIVPLYNLTDTTPGGGSVTLNPPGGTYLSNAVVTLTAAPSNGWTFLRWEGSVSGTSNPILLTMNQAKSVRAVFGTGLTTSTNLAGTSVAVWPPAGPYPYGSVVRLVGIPGAATRFNRWFNNISGPTTNILEYAVLTANTNISAFFAALTGNNFTLTTLLNGYGTVTRSPAANSYPSNTTVTLTAVPDTNSLFVNWGGDINSSINPLPVTLGTNKVIIANFVSIGSLSVAITNPADGSAFSGSTNIALGASVNSGSAVARVEFFAGTNRVLTVSNAPYTGMWSNVPIGNYILRAVAFDNTFLSATSAAVSITVTQGLNQLPLVSIIAPTNGAVLAADANVTISAQAADADGSISRVEFLAGTNLLGIVTNSPYHLVWSNIVIGSNILSALAIDNQGATNSASVAVTVAAFGGPPAFQLEQADYSFGEADGNAIIRVIRNFAGFATVNFASEDGSATAGADYNAVSGQISFQNQEFTKTISIPILEDLVVEGNHSFRVRLTLPSVGSMTNSAIPVATVTIQDNDVQLLGSFTSIVPPAAINPGDLRAMRVYLTGDGGLGQWRITGERVWRNSGSAASGLQPGEYPVEFKPVNGYLPPPPLTLAVGGQAETVSTNGYTFFGSTPSGSLTVFIDPPEVANNPDPNCRGQWTLNGSQFYTNGATIPNLPAGSYTVTFKGLVAGCGWNTPVSGEATVRPGSSNTFRGVYYTNLTGVATPGVLSFADDVSTSYQNQQPFTFVGQLSTEYGEGSGVVVKERVVLTAGHAVFDDYGLTWVANGKWYFQRQAGEYSPAPQQVRGYFVNGGYAAQRQQEGTPGRSSTASFDLDVAALYFFEAAGRGGYGGYLVSDTTNQWLQSGALKALVGYPVEGVAPGNIGKMHTVGPRSMVFEQTITTGSLFTCSTIRGLPGNSGGPLLVRYEGNNYYYPAGIYLGSSDRAIVRAIDSRAVQLINMAELASNLGTNQTGGGVIRFAISPIIGACFNNATVTLQPPEALTAGAQWRVHYQLGGLSEWSTSSTANIVLNNKPDFIELAAAEGYLTPDAGQINLGCFKTNLVFRYLQVLPRLDIFNGTNLVLSGVSNRSYRVEYNGHLVSGTNGWSLLTNYSFPANNNVVVLTNGFPKIPTNRFYRVRRLP